MDHYVLLAQLRELLIHRDAQEWADKLIAAQRSGGTSSEIIQNTGAVIRELLASADADEPDVRGLAELTLRVGIDQWNGRSPS